MFNQNFRSIAPPVTPRTKFGVSATHVQLTLNDTITLADNTAVVPSKFLVDTIVVGESTASFTSPTIPKFNRVSPPRGATRYSALRAQTRIQQLHQKEEEYDNKVRKSAERVSE